MDTLEMSTTISRRHFLWKKKQIEIFSISLCESALFPHVLKACF
jgi:hypothetical protein